MSNLKREAEQRLWELKRYQENLDYKYKNSSFSKDRRYYETESIEVMSERRVLDRIK